MTHSIPTSTIDASRTFENNGIGTEAIEDARAHLEALTSPETSPESPTERFKGRVAEMLSENFGAPVVAEESLRNAALLELDRLLLEFAGSMSLAEVAVLMVHKKRMASAVHVGLPITAKPHVVHLAHYDFKMKELEGRHPGREFSKLVGEAQQVAYSKTVKRLASRGLMEDKPFSARKIVGLISDHSEVLLAMEIEEEKNTLRSQAQRSGLDPDTCTYADLDKALYDDK